MTKTTTHTGSRRLRHVLRGFRSAPFRMLPAPFGQCVPSDMYAFEALAEEAQHSGQRTRRPSRVSHEHSRPARQDESLERQ
jgi:hypothetical protein